MNIMNKIRLFSFFLLIVSCSFSYNQEKSLKNYELSYSILFIGNSLTYSNDLPNLIKKKAKSKGMKIDCKLLAFPNYAIEDHWKDGEVQKLISSGEFDFVVLQQGPSSQTEGRNMLFEYGAKYKNLCKINNTKLCYFMVWPSLNHYNTFGGVIKNYTDAAKTHNAILFPVGKVWKEYIDKTNDYSYYSADGFHPSLKGSKIAAKTIVDALLLL